MKLLACTQSKLNDYMLYHLHLLPISSIENYLKTSAVCLYKISTMVRFTVLVLLLHSDKFVAFSFLTSGLRWRSTSAFAVLLVLQLECDSFYHSPACFDFSSFASLIKTVLFSNASEYIVLCEGRYKNVQLHYK